MATKPVFRKVTTAAESQKKNKEERANTARSSDKPIFRKVTTAWGGDLSEVKAPTHTQKPTVRGPARNNSTTPSRQQWTATNGGRKSTTNAGKQPQKTTANKLGANTRIANYTASNEQTGAAKAIDRYNSMLKSGKWADGKTLTADDRKKIQTYIAANQRKIDAHKNYTQAVENPDDPTFTERVGKTISGGAKNSAAAYTNVRGYIQEGTHMARDVDVTGWNRDLNRYQYELRNADNDADRAYWQSEIDRVRRNIQNAGKATAESNASAQKNYRLADEIAANAEKDLTRAKQGAGAVGRLLVDAGASMTQTALDAIPNLVTGGAAGMAPFAVRAFGGAAQQARQDGATWGKQGLYGAASAAKEVFTEKMFNIALPFAKAYGGGALDDVVERGIRSAVDKFAKTEVGKKALGSALTFGAGAVGEGLEEFIGDWMEWQLPRIYGGDVTTAQETLSNSLYDFLVGATSGAMGGVVSPNTYHYNLNTAQTAQQGVQERTDVQEGTRTTPAQTNAQAQQEAAQGGIQEAVQRQTVSNPVSVEEQVLRQREAAVQKTFTGIADTLGGSGKKAFQAAYQGTDRGDYAGEFLRAYHAGMTNQQNPNSTSAVSFAAYTAGQNDAASSLAREKRAAQFAKTAGTDSGLVFDDMFPVKWTAPLPTR